MSEDLLRYWREDVLLNEHHEHWHLAYPYEGLDLGGAEDERVWNRRHGELFVYMHQQLLARYSAERLSLGLPALLPLTDYRAPIPEGCSFFRQMKLDGRMVTSGLRPPGAALTGITVARFKDRPGARVENQERYHRRGARWVSDGALGSDDLSQLAERLEPTDRGASPYFGALHNDGHLLIAFHDNDEDRPGLMFWEATAISDPVFYRWHAHLDDLFKSYQEQLPAHDFADVPTDVSIDSFTVRAASGSSAEITTEMRPRLIVPSIGSSYRALYLSHEDFTYELALTNSTSQGQRKCCRIFGCPASDIEDRRKWIEMDKFMVSVAAASQAVIRRRSERSSVVRHPVLKPEALESTVARPDDKNTPPGCRCGWPYTLLVPRGTGAGLPFVFLVMLTPGDDIAGQAESGGAVSYCGVLSREYPDIRPMGYPFDRPSKGNLTDYARGSAGPLPIKSATVNVRHV